MYRNILVPHDGSELSDEAADHAIALARSVNAKLTLMHVVSHHHLVLDEGTSSKLVHRLETDYEAAARKGAEQLLAKVAARSKAGGVESASVVVVADDPYKEIIKQVRALGCDLIVMASHGRRGLEGLLLGSETVKVLTHSRTPVLVVRHR
jgi:nucleotide-binding universal stress UspA family protein